MKIKVVAHPNSKKEMIRLRGDVYHVYLKEKPRMGKANLELVSILKKHFKKNARICFGFKSKVKLVEIGDGN